MSVSVESLTDGAVWQPGAERRFLKQLRRSRRFSILYLCVPVVLVVGITYLSARQLESATAPVKQIIVQSGGTATDSEKENASALFDLVTRMQQELRLLFEQKTVLEQKVVYLEAKGAGDAGPERCGLPQPSGSAFIFFGLRNADTTPSIEAYLDTYIEGLERPGFPIQESVKQFVVHGFADPIGTARVNRDVSRKRAEAVAQYLSSKSQKLIHFEPVGHGSACADPAGHSPERDPCHRLVVVVPKGNADFRQFCSIHRKGESNEP